MKVQKFQVVIEIGEKERDREREEKEKEHMKRNHIVRGKQTKCELMVWGKNHDRSQIHWRILLFIPNKQGK